MKKISLKSRILLTPLALATVLTACSSPAPASPPVSFPAAIQVQNTDSQVITVSSSQEVYVTPDIAQLVFCVSTEARTAQECQQKNTESLNQVLEYLKSQGISEEWIQTSDYSLQPNYDWNNGRTIIGYEMSCRITVSEVPLDQAGALITNTVDQGANQVESVSYLSSKYDESYQEALKKAVEDARRKADVLAAASGCTAGAVVSMEESMPNTYLRSSGNEAKLEAAMDLAGSAARAPMDMMPGQLKVQAQVTVSFAVCPAES